MISKREAEVLFLILETPLSAIEIADALSNQSAIADFWQRATIYSILYSLEDKGLVEITWETATEDREGKRRRLYVANSTGRNTFYGHASLSNAAIREVIA